MSSNLSKVAVHAVEDIEEMYPEVQATREELISEVIIQRDKAKMLEDAFKQISKVNASLRSELKDSSNYILEITVINDELIGKIGEMYELYPECKI